MCTQLEVGDHVSRNSESGRVSGAVIKIHTKDFDYKGHTGGAAPREPQHETYCRLHKDVALTRID